MTDEEEQAGEGRGADFKHWAVGDHGEAIGGGGVDQVGVAAGDGADFIGIGCGPEAGSSGGIAEAEGAGGKELLRGLLFRVDHDFESSAFYLFGVAGIDEVTSGENGGAGGKYPGLPAMGKAEVDNRTGGRGSHGLALY